MQRGGGCTWGGGCSRNWGMINANVVQNQVRACYSHLADKETSISGAWLAAAVSLW